MRMLLGLVKPSSGSAEILGCPLTEPSSYLAKVGAMIEGPAFYPKLSAHKNLQYLQRVSGARVDHGSIEEALARVGLAGRGQENYRGFSLGMKQRLGIAAALMSAPELLILDEPTNGLDPSGIHEVRELMKRLAAQGTSVFVSSHLLSEIEMIAEYLVMLRNGKVIFSGKTESLLEAQQPIIIAKPEYAVDMSKLVAIAQQNGHSASIVEDALHVLSPAEWSATFNRLAFEAGVTLANLATVRPSLEETFFELTTESGAN